ncbi:MAG: hypothetical protein P1V81_17315 [Planctomycetota bacterium]|nr:hypothetical protein [Planctomycetota bacterium]
MSEATGQGGAQAVVTTAIGMVVGLLGRLAFWAPVIFAMAFFAQVSLKGLKPAMAEQRRLAAEEARMLGVHDELKTEQDGLGRQLEAFSDPIYLERERRAQLMRDAAPEPVLSPTPFSTKQQAPVDGGGTASSGGSANDGPTVR